jgi:2-C-methyl-D-erythritol 2,4-cyclodiphosphate synthase
VSEAPGVGLGFDVHASAPGRELRLAGVPFEGETGLAGHSDGDVVCHAVADAVLGAAALGDVGEHVPDDDPSTAGIAGESVLRRVIGIVAEAGRVPVSIDVTVVCDRPRIAERREEMRARLGELLGLPVGAVSVKATRPEGLGLTGDGIGCLAVAVIR